MPSKKYNSKRTEFDKLLSQEEIDQQEFRPLRWVFLRQPKVAIKAGALLLAVALGYTSLDTALNMFIVDDILINPIPRIESITQEVLPRTE